MPYYIIDKDAETADGPLAGVSDVIEEFSSRTDEDREDCLVAEVAEDGSMTITDVHDWLTANEGGEGN